MKPTYVGLALSVLGSLLIALSPASIAFLLLTRRIIQGLSAARIMPATLALLKDFFDGKERQRAVCWADCVIGPSATLDSRSAGSGVRGRDERLRQGLGVPGSIVTDTVDEHCRCTVDAASHATHEVFLNA